MSEWDSVGPEYLMYKTAWLRDESRRLKRRARREERKWERLQREADLLDMLDG